MKGPGYVHGRSVLVPMHRWSSIWVLEDVAAPYKVIEPMINEQDSIA